MRQQLDFQCGECGKALCRDDVYAHILECWAEEHGDLLRRSIETSTTAFEKNTALTEEAENAERLSE